LYMVFAQEDGKLIFSTFWYFFVEEADIFCKMKNYGNRNFILDYFLWKLATALHHTRNGIRRTSRILIKFILPIHLM
jgi:hypothetical protein